MEVPLSGLWDADDLNHDPALAQALGHMVVAWARAETQLTNVFARISRLHFNDVAPAYSRIGTFESRVKFLRALIAQWTEESVDRAAIDRAIEILSRLSKTRNGWVHGTWCTDPDRKRTFIVDARMTNEAKPVKSHDVQNHVSAVIAQAKALNALIPLPYDPHEP